MIIDTHCHIYYSEVENSEEIIKECKKNNIVMILNGIDKKSNLEVLELSKKYDNVYAAIGYDHSVVKKIANEHSYIYATAGISPNDIPTFENENTDVKEFFFEEVLNEQLKEIKRLAKSE